MDCVRVIQGRGVFSLPIRKTQLQVGVTDLAGVVGLSPRARTKERE